MSLNSQILATMADEGILDESSLPVPTETFGKKLEVNTGSNVPSGSQSPMTEEIKQKLLNPQTVFKSLENQVESISTMEQMNDQIATKPAISFADAKEVAMTFESFHKALPLNSFTKLPSQVNLKDTKAFMTKEISLRKESLSTEAEAYFDGHLADAEKAFEDFSTFYGDKLKDDLSCFQTKANEFLSSKSGMSNQVFQSGNDFLNIATVALKDLPKDLELPGEKDLFLDAVNNLTNLQEENMHVKNLLLVIQAKGGFDDFSDPVHTAKAVSYNPTLKDYLEAFADPYLKGFVTKLEEDASNALDELRGIQDTKDFNPTDFKSMRDFVVENGKDIDECNSQVHYYIEVVELIQKLHLNASVVLDYFAV